LKPTPDYCGSLVIAKAASSPPLSSVASLPGGLERRFKSICEELLTGLTGMDIT